ncbi:U5 snRNP protein, DIM1 family [Angomonas deanei]|nr:U5 snRNP protein, DIM1 family [Angomonas deanei]|eukprot:EPY43829.1 U5 snRNP protein, DIM1 family [Angomonas deanei]
MKYHTDTLHMDELLTALAPKVRKYAKIYLVDTTKVTEFNHMYELAHDREPFAVMFFFKGEHIRVDVGTGNFNKVNFFAFESMDDFLPIVDSAYRAGMLGKTMTTTEKSFSSVSVQR